jgi:BirA family biotin operon repressor/biotin-[acetyl-CoA-carboxylase] ligase
MAAPPLQWNATALWRELEPLLPGLSVEVVARTASTNTALLERSRIGRGLADDHGQVQIRASVEGTAFGRRAADVQPCLLVAEHQTGGRGRQGRSWQSTAGASLTFSLSLPLARADWSGLSLALGVALAEVLDPPAARPHGPPRLGIKWPNDLWLMDDPDAGTAAAGRKLGGILIETVSAGSQRLAVIGVGLNILPIDLAEASSGFACLSEFDPQASAPSTLARVALPLVQAIQRFEREGFPAFADGFKARDILFGRNVRTTSPEVPEGVARGLSAQGALLVLSGSDLKAVTGGEVSVRLRSSEAAC